MAAPTPTQSTKTSAAGASSISITLPETPSLDSYLVLLWTAYTGGATVTSVADNQSGNTWDARAYQTHATLDIAAGIRTCKPLAASGDFTVTITMSGGGCYFSAALYEISGVDITTPIEAAGAGSQGNGAAPVANIADTTNDCLKLGVMIWWDDGNTGGAGAGWDLGQSYVNSGVDQGMIVVLKSVTGADTSDPTFAISSADDWTAAGIALRGTMVAIPTLSAAGVQNITATSARPKVTLAF